ncbi:aldehyde dehydrogenase [Mycobacterium mantenii]|uniref:Aldehyde dehydrogenase n=1 Tax=Mycobacterium mantenii TaxID=560555 RepID=A0A1X0FT35_MYCNT|nr:aldehyde dehydrogenase family protein [Mycobacterium mantenii]MCV7243508.1 aldehyde dehydrogenase family protein [Mycobacterium mantenii]ORB04937.1 aldehyde dehydrogenase family protein [Mycobacterium mantenii]BBY38163.1 aldehyde dehydrogenase [Mycobacterium mantenii]
MPGESVGAAEADQPPVAEAAEIVNGLRATFRAGVTRPVAWRRSQLAQLRRMLVECQDELLEAVCIDLGKASAEAYAADVGFALAEIRHMEAHLEEWMAPQRVPLGLKLRPGSARVVREPLGVVLVIAPWNLPVQLLVVPMATALASGNAVLGKPSEVTPGVSALLARLIPQYLDERATAIAEGGVEETTALLEQRFDHIFYTGNGQVGRIVMAAAARHLTPVTLELGGKSPVIVDRSAKLDVAARRIAWGKFTNAGQACIAPDYVLVHRDVAGPLVERLTAAVRDFYGDDPKSSGDFSRIVNARHWRRLKGLLDAGGFATVACGGDSDEATNYLAPTILTGVAADAAVMRDEIFGPILPVLAVDDVDAAIEHVNAGEKPLALYAFSEDRFVVDRIIGATSSGGVCVNGTILQVAVSDLPFGGVGASGIGAYHGRWGFDTYSHRRAVLTRSTRFDPPMMYPPIGPLKARLMRRFL